MDFSVGELESEPERPLFCKSGGLFFVIKGYLDAEGNPQEQIFELAWASDKRVNTNGKLLAIGPTVDVATATYTNDIGAVSLQIIWTDPDFDASQSAFFM